MPSECQAGAQGATSQVARRALTEYLRIFHRLLSILKRHPHKNVGVPFRDRFSARGLWACQWFVIHVPKP